MERGHRRQAAPRVGVQAPDVAGVNGPDSEVLLRELALQGHVYLWGPITEETARRCAWWLHWAEEHSYADPLYLWICSPGGDLYQALALHDIVDGLKRDVCTVAVGWTASGGVLVLQAGSTRYAMPGTWLMIHEVQVGLPAELRASDLADEATLVERLNELVLDIYAKRASVKRRTLRRLYERRDAWMDAREALRYGLVDAIWGGDVG